MVKKIRKLRESEEEIEMKESEEVKDVEMNEEDEMSAVREACAKIHEKANKIKEEDENKELDVVFGDIKESLDDIKESLDKLVAEEDEIKESEEEMSLEEEIEEIKESLDKLVAEEDEKLMEEVSDDKVEEIKESLDKLVAEEEMSLEEAEEIRDELKDLAESLDKLVAEEEMIEESEEEEVKESEEEMVEEDEKETIEESVNRIFKKSRLSESTKQAIVTLIEAKVKEETEEKIKEIEEKAEEYGEYLKNEAEEKIKEIEEKAEEYGEYVKSELEEKADAYLTDVAEEWVEENKLAVEEGVKSEIAESIMTGFKKVLAENNIFIPENKRDLLEETLSVNKRLQNKLGEKLATIAKLQEEKKSLLKYKLIEENSKELSLAQKSKLTNLLENVNYRNEDELVRKINVLKENYLSTARPSVNESTSRKVATRSTQNDSIYESYANFIEKSAK